MKDFEVTQVQAEAIRKSVVEHGGDLFFGRSGITIHLINHFPIVIGPAEEKGRQRVKRMTVITSEEIANEEWFKPFIEHEAQRTRMHRVDAQRRKDLNSALNVNGTSSGTGLETFEHLRSNISPQRWQELKKRRYKDAT